MSDLVVELFSPADQAAARALILSGMEEHWGALDLSLNPDLNDITANYADGVFLVARIDDLVVGAGALVPEGVAVGRIVRMSVAKAYRRFGVGTCILHALLDQARSCGYCKIVLETTESWDDAINFYLRNGLRIVERRDGEAHFEMALRDER